VLTPAVLTLLIVKVAENIEDYKRFFEEVKGNEYEYAHQTQHVAFSKMLGSELTGLGLSTKSCVVIHEEVISIVQFN
jgi:hypothetical protein